MANFVFRWPFGEFREQFWQLFWGNGTTALAETQGRAASKRVRRNGAGALGGQMDKRSAGLVAGFVLAVSALIMFVGGGARFAIGLTLKSIDAELSTTIAR